MRWHPAIRASFWLLYRGEKEALPKSRQAFEAAAAETFGVVDLFFSFSNYFSSTSIRLMLNRVSYSRARCSKQTAIRPGFKYLSNMPRMLNKDLTRFKHSLSRVHQNRASERRVLIAVVRVDTWPLKGCGRRYCFKAIVLSCQSN